jgi:hypothetical protein
MIGRMCAVKFGKEEKRTSKRWGRFEITVL